MQRLLLEGDSGERAVQGSTTANAMAILVHETVPVIVKSKAGNCRGPTHGATAPVAKIAASLLTGILCTAASVMFLLSLAIVMPVLTRQFGTWLATGQWNPVPLAATATRMGFSPDLGGATSSSVIDWLISCESGMLILPTAATFGCAVWGFEAARSWLKS